MKHENRQTKKQREWRVDGERKENRWRRVQKGNGWWRKEDAEREEIGKNGKIKERERKKTRKEVDKREKKNNNTIK